MKEENHISKIELTLIIGIVGCMFLATWELGHLMTDKWFEGWVKYHYFIRERIIRYGVAFFFAGTSLGIAVLTIHQESRFMAAINRALLWFGVSLLMSTIIFFLFDCLPEVAAGFLGAMLFGTTIYFVQKRYFTPERRMQIHKKRGQCPVCSMPVDRNDHYCSECGTNLIRQCSSCKTENMLYDKYCKNCGHIL
ncbi:MAG: zinc ribbon domain-containing protein [Chitinophagales bacterium]